MGVFSMWSHNFTRGLTISGNCPIKSLQIGAEKIKTTFSKGNLLLSLTIYIQLPQSHRLITQYRQWAKYNQLIASTRCLNDNQQQQLKQSHIMII